MKEYHLGKREQPFMQINGRLTPIAGANILLAHFHYCNKGRHPFSGNCSEHTIRTLGDLTDEKWKSVKAIRAYAAAHRKWRDAFDTNNSVTLTFFF